MPKLTTSEITPEHSEQDEQTQSSESLPPEIWQHILEYLPYADLTRFRAANRQYENCSRRVFEERRRIVLQDFMNEVKAFNKFISERSDTREIPQILYNDIMTKFIREHGFKSLMGEPGQWRTQNLTNPNSKSGLELLRSLLQDHDELKYLTVPQRKLLRNLSPNCVEEMDPQRKQYLTPLLLWAVLYGYTYLFRFLLNNVKVNPDEVLRVLDNGDGIISVCDSDSYHEKQLLGVGEYRTTVLIRILYEIKKYNPIAQPGELYGVVEILLAHGADPNFMCPMHKLLPSEKELKNLSDILKASNGCFKLLLKYGADVNIKETRWGKTVLQRVEKLTKGVPISIMWKNYEIDYYSRCSLKTSVRCAYHFNKAIECLNNFSPYESNLKNSYKSNRRFFEELVSHYLTKSWPYKKLSEQGQERLRIWYEQRSEQNQQELGTQPQPYVEPAGFTP